MTAATLIGRHGPYARHHAEVGCKNESEIVQTPSQITVETTAVAWALILKQEHVMPYLVQVITFYIYTRFVSFQMLLCFSGTLAYSQVANQSMDNKNETALFYSSQLMEASQTGHRLLNVQRLAVGARSFGPEIAAIQLHSSMASHVTILEKGKRQESVTQCSARVRISVKAPLIVTFINTFLLLLSYSKFDRMDKLCSIISINLSYFHHIFANSQVNAS